MGSSRAQNQVILHDLRDDRHGESVPLPPVKGQKANSAVVDTRRNLIDKESLEINILERILIENAGRIFRGLL